MDPAPIKAGITVSSAVFSQLPAEVSAVPVPGLAALPRAEQPDVLVVVRMDASDRQRLPRIKRIHIRYKCAPSAVGLPDLIGPIGESHPIGQNSPRGRRRRRPPRWAVVSLVLIERRNHGLDNVVHLSYGMPGTGKHYARRQRRDHSSRRDDKSDEVVGYGVHELFLLS